MARYGFCSWHYLTKEMPIGFSQAESTFKSIHPELEDASRIIGANRLMSLKDVTAPLARSGLIAAWSFIFIGVIRELSASILLFAPKSKVVSVVIFDLKEEGQVGVIAVLGILLLAGFLRGDTCGPVVRRTRRGGDEGIVRIFGGKTGSRRRNPFGAKAKRRWL